MKSIPPKSYVHERYSIQPVLYEFAKAINITVEAFIMQIK